MKNLSALVLIILLAACTASPATRIPAPPTGTPNLQETSTAQVYVSWTQMYQTLTAQPTGTPVPTATKLPAAQSAPQPGSSLLLSKLEMTDSSNGWALVSGKDSVRWCILRTTDGGLTWQDVTPPQVIGLSERGAWFFGSLAALDGKTAWAIADGSSTGSGALFGTVWQTQDGGQSWRPGNPITIYDPAPETYVNGYETQLQFADAKHGWLRARVQLAMAHFFDTWFHTSDGGVTWERLPNGCAGGDWPSGCDYFFVDIDTGFRSAGSWQTQWLPMDEIKNGSNWQIEKTTNAGRDWTKITLPLLPDLEKSLFDGQGYPAAEILTFKITISKRIQEFAPGVIGIRLDFSVFPSKPTIQPLFVKSYQYLSADKGLTWRTFPFSGNSFFLDAATGWRLSEQNGSYVIEKTSDGGSNWQAINKAAFPGNGTLLFKDASNGWIMINEPGYYTQRLMRSTDGGQTWTEISQNLLDALGAASVSVIPPSQTPSGTSALIPEEPWIAHMTAGSPLVLNSLHMIDELNGWGTSLNGYIFHTTDGGRTWQDVTPRYGTVTSQRNFSALDALHAWTRVAPLPSCLAGNSSQSCPEYYLTKGPIWATSNGGQTWQPLGQFPETNRPAAWTSINIRFSSERLGWAEWLSRLPNDNHASDNLSGTADGGLTWDAPLTSSYLGGGNTIFLDRQLGFRATERLNHFLRIDQLTSGAIPIKVDKTTDGGKTWEPISLPNFVISADEIKLHRNVLPKVLDQLPTYEADCSFPELTTFGLHSVGLRYACYLMDFGQFSEYYYSPDGGQSWHNWTSSGNEFFLGNGVGWRLHSAGSAQSNLLHTSDGGASWTTIKSVGWQKAQFDFIDKQTGWALVTGPDTTALVHTSDGGQTWTEIKPIIANQ